MLPHTGLFLLWKVALQMRIRRRLKFEMRFQTTYSQLHKILSFRLQTEYIYPHC